MIGGFSILSFTQGFLLAAEAMEDVPVDPMTEYPGMGLFSLFIFASWVVSVIGLPFWVWMLWHCYQNEPDREFWFWVMIFIPPASLVYFFARFLNTTASAPQGFKRLSRKREIERLEIAARQIGNAHQWVQLGDARREVGRDAEAAEAYQQALAKEADNIQALYGAGLTSLKLKRFEEAADSLKTALDQNPEYKFGDLSLAYGQTLADLGQTDAAAEHLTKHIARWRNPEAIYLLATLELDRNNPAVARDLLENLILDIDGSPKSIARKQGPWKSRARKLLKQLPS